MPSPAITVIGNLQNLLGQLDSGGKVIFTLVGYSSGDVPRVAGTSIIITPVITAVAAAGSFSVTLWGNDVITPANTFYQADFYDDAGRKLATVGYTFIGAGTIDISTQTPINAGPTLTAPPPGAVLLNPNSGQTIQGQPLTVTAVVTASNFVTGGFVQHVEGSAPSGVPGSDLIWGDSSHRLKMNNNNAGPDFVVGAATVDTLTNKTIGAGGLGGIGLQRQVFASSGTFTIPTGVTQVKVTIVGAGGAGGGANNTPSSGTGGGAGAATIKWFTGWTPGNTITVTVGTGGVGVSNANGGNGGSSSISSGTQTIVTLTAGGGNGGSISSQASGQVGGLGGSVSGGDINLTGGAGSSTWNATLGSEGAVSIYGGAGFGNNGGSGGVGASPGAGGGGGGAGAGNALGGNGANGLVVFEWVS